MCTVDKQAYIGIQEGVTSSLYVQMYIIKDNIPQQAVCIQYSSLNIQNTQTHSLLYIAQFVERSLLHNSLNIFCKLIFR